METTTTIKALAAEAYEHFEQIDDLKGAALNIRTTRESETGRPWWRTTDAAPQWIKDLCHAAHAYLLPDDWRYEFTADALYALSEHDDVDEARDSLEPDIYNAPRLRWLASHLERAGYCDEVLEEFGGDIKCTLDLIGYGQNREQREVFDAVLAFLTERQEEIESETP